MRRYGAPSKRQGKENAKAEDDLQLVTVATVKQEISADTIPGATWKSRVSSQLGIDADTSKWIWFLIIVRYWLVNWFASINVKFYPEDFTSPWSAWLMTNRETAISEISAELEWQIGICLPIKLTYVLKWIIIYFLESDILILLQMRITRVTKQQRQHQSSTSNVACGVYRRACMAVWSCVCACHFICCNLALHYHPNN